MKNTNNKHAGNGNHKHENGVHEQTAAERGMRELFVSELEGIYWAEKAMVKALPEMIKNTSSHKLRKALKEHLEITKQQVTDVEKVFELIGQQPEAVKSEVVKEMVKEAEIAQEKKEDEIVTDARIILAALKIEHYEIATYGTLCSFAKNFGENYVAALLHKILNEEKDANEKLSEIVELLQFEMAEIDNDAHLPLIAKKRSKTELN